MDARAGSATRGKDHASEKTQHKKHLLCSEKIS
jgi:hypothetical protein